MQNFALLSLSSLIGKTNCHPYPRSSSSRHSPPAAPIILAVMLLFVGAAVTFTAGGAAAESYPITFQDDLGQVFTLKAKPQRIISLAPSLTEILFALGLGEQVVAIDSYSNYPPATADIEKVGSGLQPSIERLVALQPDIVFLWDLATEDLQRQLQRVNIVAVTFAPQTITQVMDCIRRIGEITGTTAAAAEVVAGMQKTIDQVAALTAGIKVKPKVFFEIWPDPLMSAGPGSFVHELIGLAGGENVAGDTKTAWPVISVEHVVLKNPDVILTPFDQTMTVVYGKNKAWFAGVNAVKNGRIHQVDQDLISRAGPRMTEGLLLIAKSLHPELFP
ncbi:MAG TPA: ABC transporter substrate-binding protein [Firmicutes bacterium]|nr:ABC transporter substrate-binding protein [Bacillota bacterium]